MRWQSFTDLEDLTLLLREAMGGEPPASYEVWPPGEVRREVERPSDLAREQGVRVADTASGLPLFWLDLAEGFETFLSFEQTVNEFVYALDSREWIQVEYGASYPSPVDHDIHTQIEGFDVVGPGGRLVKAMAGRIAMMSVSIHPRGQAVSAPWRDPDSVATGMIAQLRELPGDVAYRFAAGYFEPSASEAATHIRPVAVVVAEGREEGAVPWRISLVEPTTESDDLPPELGLEGVSGACL